MSKNLDSNRMEKLITTFEKLKRLNQEEQNEICIRIDTLLCQQERREFNEDNKKPGLTR